MGLFSRFEDKAEDVIEGGGGRGGIEPVKLAKRAAKEMQREKMIGVGREYAPTLYNVLVSIEDDRRMGGYYPSLAGEIETYLTGRAEQAHLVFDCPPLVRFIVDEGLKRGKFDIIAESVSPAIIEELRQEEMEHYGLDNRIDVNPVMRHSTSPSQAGPEPAEFDPFVPADMQSAHYIPEDSPARHNSDMLREHTANSAPVVPVMGAAAVATAPSAAETAMAPEAHRKETVPSGAQSCLFNFETNKRYPLGGLHKTLGRGTDNEIVISDSSASRHHAVMDFSLGAWTITDCNSTNGTFLNGEPITKHILRNGDVIEVGTTRLEYREG